ncbi:MAG: methyltransferase [Deltaproteobacteria bacterium]|nr:methyltransferase [Deltaproteobacteria bacterium]
MSKDKSISDKIELIGPYSMVQSDKGQRLTQDPFLLTDFLLPLKKEDTVIDLGTGTGIIPLLLCSRTEAQNIIGVEIEAKAAAIAGNNIEMNGLSGRVSIIEADYRELRGMYPQGAFTVIVSNPPYTKANSGRVSPNKERAMARSEVAGTLSELVSISKYLLSENGRIFYIFPVSRLFEMLGEVREAGLRARRLRFIHTSPKKAARLFMIEIGFKGELKVEEPVFL